MVHFKKRNKSLSQIHRLLNCYNIQIFLQVAKHGILCNLGPTRTDLPSPSVTRLGNLLDFGQLFIAFCNN